MLLRPWARVGLPAGPAVPGGPGAWWYVARPVQSPESNGVVEAFFGTLKRDHISQNCLEALADLERQLPAWIADHNDVAPHSALGMRSPAQFYEEWMVKTG